MTRRSRRLGQRPQGSPSPLRLRRYSRRPRNRNAASCADTLIHAIASQAAVVRPVVAIVGAGRVGCALGRRLREKGWRIGPVITRSMRTARAARRRIGSGKPQAGFSEAVLAADLILIATPDRAIAETADALARIGAGPRLLTRRNDKYHWSSA